MRCHDDSGRPETTVQLPRALHLATATMLPSAARAARRRSTSRARGERVNDVEMGSTKLHR
eukprot:2673082-Prymnesium_polylepis.1